MRVAVLACACAAIAFAVVGGRAHLRLATALAPVLEGADIDVVGVVAALPRHSPEGAHFEFEVASVRIGADATTLPPLPPRLLVGWYREGHVDDEAQSGELPRVAAGERWQLTLRLRRPHGLANPHGFDFELWLFERGLAATASVRPGGDNRRLGVDTSRGVERARQSIRDAIERRVADPRAAGLLAALAVGDQSAIDRQAWDLYRNTGVAHLMSISGLHVTMFAWLAAALIGRLWRRSLRACLLCPAPIAARLGGVLLAAGYAVLAGWGVPAQRTVWMLAAVVALQLSGRRWPWPWVLASAALVVVVIDPWAWLQPGFWLSFVAVGLLMLADGGGAGGAARAAGEAGGRREGGEGEGATRGAGRDHDNDAARVSGSADVVARVLAWMRVHAGAGLRTQAIATLGLTPLTLLFFQQVSIVGFAANLIAIPVITLLVTPLALAGAIAPPLWALAALVIEALHHVLAAMGRMPAATWWAAVAPWWAQAAGLLAGALAVAPLPWRARVLALPLALPLLWPPVPRPEHGRYEVVAVDVGQGTAVLVRTRTKLLVFDAGPAYARERDAGERVLVPLLRARGEARIDRLMLSHQDSDHVGGAAALLSALPVVELSSSLPEGHALRRPGLPHRACLAGTTWQWDGVAFEVLHPLRPLDTAASRVKPNATSCVLRVTDAMGHALLVTGDIEAAQERELVAAGAPLRAQALVVAHHGSRTSTTLPWLEAVQPHLAVVQAGYRNRFGHPAPVVEQRLLDHGVRVWRSDRCGAWTWHSDGEPRCEREQRLRYWHTLP